MLNSKNIKKNKRKPPTHMARIFEPAYEKMLLYGVDNLTEFVSDAVDEKIERDFKK